MISILTQAPYNVTTSNLDVRTCWCTREDPVLHNDLKGVTFRFSFLHFPLTFLGLFCVSLRQTWLVCF